VKLLTLAEAAQFFRMSRSSLYQRKDIPRYRPPGSRVILFDQDELEAWLKQGRVAVQDAPVPGRQATTESPEAGAGIVDISAQRVYHRNARYR
jgi:predicted DNA-binding transcriptional regulator AlpA